MSRRSDMKMDLKYESYIDLSPQHIAALRNLINAMMKSVGEHGEFRIDWAGPYTTGHTWPPVRWLRFGSLRSKNGCERVGAWRSHRLRADGHPRQCCCRKIVNETHPVIDEGAPCHSITSSARTSKRSRRRAIRRSSAPMVNWSGRDLAI